MIAQLIRQQKIQQRSNLPFESQQAAAASIVAQLFALPVVQSAKTIAVYCAIQGEVPTQSLIQQLEQVGKIVCFPRMRAGSRVLDFYRVDRASDLNPNRSGILEPPVDAAKYIARENLDVVLVPVVAFTNHGDRLGMGGGYYDASFSFRKESSTRSPVLIGLAYAFQCVDCLERQPWDVPMDIVVTD